MGELLSARQDLNLILIFPLYRLKDYSEGSLLRILLHLNISSIQR